ncbi:glycosyltransferase family 4 protein [Paenibacillus hemerocallicola]|nr:glycosyltransferase family 4 protein [Paenibacillus hemerocallicola]
MINVKVINKARGFWINLFDYNFETIRFHYKSSELFEVSSKTRFIINKVINYRVFDFIGLFLRKKVKGSNRSDVYFSYNRFLKSDKPYFIGLENPTALVHYSDTRMTTFISKLRLKRCLGDLNLKGVICLSKACYTTIGNYYDLPKTLNIYQIYPFVQESDINEDQISKKSKNNVLECLYVSSNFELKGGDDILEAFGELKRYGYTNVHLTIITKLDGLTQKQQNIIKNNSNILSYDFTFSKNELYEFYKKANVLLNPTRMDSFSLVTLEAMKNGCTIIGTDIYAIKEMVEDGVNGFLTEPRYKYWNSENMVDHYIKMHSDKTFNSKYIDENIIQFLYNKIVFLYNDRKVLEEFSINAFKKSTTGEFANKNIALKWEKIINQIGV